MSRARHVRRSVAVGVALFVATGYVASALVLAGPKTPITFRLHPVVASYMHPHFPQNWNLFAPDPVNEERGLLARFRCRSGEVTGWANVTTRGVERVQATRLFPSRESRVVSNGLIMRFREDDILARVDPGDRAGVDQPGPSGTDGPVVGAPAESTLDPLRDALSEDRAAVERVLARYAVARASERCTSAAVAEVQLRYVFHAFPGWSAREDLEAIGRVDTIDSGWVRP